MGLVSDSFLGAELVSDADSGQERVSCPYWCWRSEKSGTPGSFKVKTAQMSPTPIVLCQPQRRGERDDKRTLRQGTGTNMPILAAVIYVLGQEGGF